LPAPQHALLAKGPLVATDASFSASQRTLLLEFVLGKKPARIVATPLPGQSMRPGCRAMLAES